MSVMVQLIALMAAMKMTALVFVSDCGKMGISKSSYTLTVWCLTGIHVYLPFRLSQLQVSV